MIFQAVLFSLLTFAAEGPTPLLNAPISNQSEWYHLGNSWQFSRGENVIVAVIDSGISNHPDIVNSVMISADGTQMGYNFLDENNDLADHQGHGTMVAGLIAGRRTGVAPEAKILTLKAFDTQQANVRGTNREVAKAVEFAIFSGAKIINISASGSIYSTLLQAALEKARDADVLVVVAAGNRMQDNDVKPVFPCNYELSNIICVTFLLNEQKHRAANFGARSVDLIVNFQEAMSFPNSDWQNSGLYRTDFGTSLAAPIVSGAAALMRSFRPRLTAQQIKTALMGAGHFNSLLRPIARASRTLDVEAAMIRAGAARPRP